MKQPIVKGAVQMETLPAEQSNLFLTTEAHDLIDLKPISLDVHFDEHEGKIRLEEVREEKESYPHTYRSGEIQSKPASNTKFVKHNSPVDSKDAMLKHFMKKINSTNALGR